MESIMGLVINFVWSSVWCGWQVQSSSGSLCHRWCSGRWKVGWSPVTLDAPSCVVCCPPAPCFACPHPFSNSTPPCTAVVWYLLPGAWVNVCKFKIALADILENAVPGGLRDGVLLPAPPFSTSFGMRHRPCDACGRAQCSLRTQRRRCML